MKFQKRFYDNDQVLKSWVLYLIILLCLIALMWALSTNRFDTQSAPFIIQHVEYLQGDVSFMNRIDPQTVITTLDGRRIVLNGLCNTPPIGTKAVVFCDGLNTYIKPLE